MAETLRAEVRDLLIEHIDGKVGINGSIKPGCMTEKWDRHMRRRLVQFCVNKDWLSFDHRVYPKFTTLTEAGKMVLCAALAEWADAIIRAGEWEKILGPVPGYPDRSLPKV